MYGKFVEINDSYEKVYNISYINVYLNKLE